MCAHVRAMLPTVRVVEQHSRVKTNGGLLAICGRARNDSNWPILPMGVGSCGRATCLQPHLRRNGVIWRRNQAILPRQQPGFRQRLNVLVNAFVISLQSIGKRPH